MPFDWMPIEIPEPLRRLPSTATNATSEDLKQRITRALMPSSSIPAITSRKIFLCGMPTILTVCESPNAGPTAMITSSCCWPCLASPISVRKLSPCTAAACGALAADDALNETGLSLVCISDSTSSIIWRSSFSLISIFHPLAKFVGIKCARDVFDLFPAFALQAITCCRTGIVIDVIYCGQHLSVANDNGGGMQIIPG